MPTIVRSPNEQFNALGRDLLETMTQMESHGEIESLRELMAEDYPVLAANLDLQGEFSETQRKIMHEISERLHERSLEVDPVPPIPSSRDQEQQQEQEAAPQAAQGTLGIPLADNTPTRGESGSSFPR
jgi:hypothetical protein